MLSIVAVNLFTYHIQFQNSTFNVSKSTLEVMKEEFRLSLAICEEIIAGKVNIHILLSP